MRCHVEFCYFGVVFLDLISTNSNRASISLGIKRVNYTGERIDAFTQMSYSNAHSYVQKSIDLQVLWKKVLQNRLIFHRKSYRKPFIYRFQKSVVRQEHPIELTILYKSIGCMEKCFIGTSYRMYISIEIHKFYRSVPEIRPIELNIFRSLFDYRNLFHRSIPQNWPFY